jgi:hypothetical protein
METVAEIGTWLSSLDAGFAFLLALPFIVAIAGFLGEYLLCRPSATKARRR